MRRIFVAAAAAFTLVLGSAPVNAVAQEHVVKVYTLAVNEAQLNLIGNALGKLPYEQVVTTINSLAMQVKEQQKKAAAALKKPTLPPGNPGVRRIVPPTSPEKH